MRAETGTSNEPVVLFPNIDISTNNTHRDTMDAGSEVILTCHLRMALFKFGFRWLRIG